MNPGRWCVGQTSCYTEDDADTGPPKRARTVRRKETQATPTPSDFAPRVSSAWKVGAHVSAAGGVDNTVVNAARVRYVACRVR